MRKKNLLPILRHYNHDLSRKWYIEYYDDGKRKKKYGILNQMETAQARLAQAEAMIRTMVMGVQKTDGSKCHIIYHLDKSLKARIPSLRKKSIQGYTSNIRVFSDWLYMTNKDGYTIKTLKRADIQEFSHYLTFDKKLGGARHNAIIVCLRSLFNWIQQRDVILVNPFIGVPLRAKHSVPAASFPDAKLESIKDIMKEAGWSLYLTCMIQLYAFIRPAEIRKLKVKNINLLEKKITIPAEISKNKRTQQVVIMPKLYDILCEYLSQNEATESHYLIGMSNKPSVKPIGENSLAYKHQEILKSNNIRTDKHKLYSWKHTGNRLAYKNGATLKFLKMQNRHSSESTTELYLRSITIEDLVIGQEEFFDF